MDLSLEAIRAVVPDVSAQEAAALADWYAALSRALADFPWDDLKRVEPPLRSTPGPL